MLYLTVLYLTVLPLIVLFPSCTVSECAVPSCAISVVLTVQQVSRKHEVLQAPWHRMRDVSFKGLALNRLLSECWHWRPLQLLRNVNGSTKARIEWPLTLTPSPLSFTPSHLFSIIQWPQLGVCTPQLGVCTSVVVWFAEHRLWCAEHADF